MIVKKRKVVNSLRALSQTAIGLMLAHCVIFFPVCHLMKPWGSIIILKLLINHRTYQTCSFVISIEPSQMEYFDHREPVYHFVIFCRENLSADPWLRIVCFGKAYSNNNQYFASKVTLCCLCFGRSNLLFLNSKRNIYRLVDSGKYFLLEPLILSVVIFITSKFGL